MKFRMLVSAAMVSAISVPFTMTGIAAADATDTYIDYCGPIKNKQSDGQVWAFATRGCNGTVLGSAGGDDYNWGDGQGGFQGIATNSASSVLNDGTNDSPSVVAFYDYTAYSSEYGYICLDRGDWAPDLSKNTFTPRLGGPRWSADNAISSHKWVTRSACALGSWVG